MKSKCQLHHNRRAYTLIEDIMFPILGATHLESGYAQKCMIMDLCILRPHLTLKKKSTLYTNVHVVPLDMGAAKRIMFPLSTVYISLNSNNATFTTP